MSNRDQRWDLVGDAVAARMDELHLSYAHIERDHGISYKTLRAYIAGHPITRVDKRKALCEALLWSSGSITSLLEGRGPITLEDELSDTEGSMAMASAEVAFAGDSEDVRTYERLKDRVNLLRERLGRPPHEGFREAESHVELRRALREATDRPNVFISASLDDITSLRVAQLATLMTSMLKDQGVTVEFGGVDSPDVVIHNKDGSVSIIEVKHTVKSAKRPPVEGDQTLVARPGQFAVAAEGAGDVLPSGDDDEPAQRPHPPAEE